MNEQELFLSALEVTDPERRASFLRDACGGDAELLSRVESLFEFSGSDEGFLAVPAIEQIAGAMASDAGQTIRLEDDTAGNERLYGPDLDATNSSLTRKFVSATDPADSLWFLNSSSTPGSLGRLGHYDVREVLGRGAFGIVFRAFDEKLHRTVAIKVLAGDSVANASDRRRLLREARASAAIRHENVVRTFAVEHDPLPYLVMEYVPGQTLQQRLDEDGLPAIDEALSIAEQIASGLAAAHAMQLIHLDIKPGNILLEAGQDVQVRITDFGLARPDDDPGSSQSRMISGTPLYMAPEQATAGTLDQRTDLFSLGSVLYRMLTGVSPCAAADSVSVLGRLVEETPVPLTNLNPAVPEWLSRITAKLLEKNPDDRFSTAAEVAALLRKCREAICDGNIPDTAWFAPANPSHVVPAQSEFLSEIRRASGSRTLTILIALVVVLCGVAVLEFTGVTGLYSTIISPDAEKSGRSVDGNSVSSGSQSGD